MKRFHKSALVLFLSFINFSVCTQSFSPEMMKKMDPPLRRYLQSNVIVPAQFSGTCHAKISQKEKAQINDIGIQLRTVTGNLFTASGSREQIIKLSTKKWIKKLQLSKKVHLLEE